MQHYPYIRKGHPHQANLLKQEAWRERACPWNICAKSAQKAGTEKTNAVFRRRLTRVAVLSAAAEAIVCRIPRGCESIRNIVATQ